MRSGSLRKPMNARVLCCDKERVKNKVASKFKVSFFDEQKHEN